MLLKVRQIFALAQIAEPRLLPRPGRILVSSGQEVHAQETIAEAAIGREHILLDLTQLLNLPPGKAQQALVCKEGQHIQKGDVLAQHKGLIPRTVRAPQEGIVLLADEGKILLETKRSKHSLSAGLPGQVQDIIEGLGVTIQAQGALIEGLWGNQRIESGQLLPVIEKPDDILKSEDVDVSKRSMVVVGGHCRDKEILQMAHDSVIRGLILSSLHPALIPTAMKMPYPIMTTDGLGRRAMNQAAFKLLTSNTSRQVTVFAQRFDYYEGTRPKALISIPNMSNFPEHELFASPEEGQQVIITAHPHYGQTGFIRSLPERKAKLPNGVHAYVAHVELDSGDNVIVPLSNLEIIQ